MEEIETRGVRASSEYIRLRFVMDYWRALFFWPIEQSHLLPSRNEWLTDLDFVLTSGTIQAGADEQQELFASSLAAEYREKYVNKLGIVNIEELIREIPRFKIVKECARRYKFFHWELEYADIFKQRGGFDLILGNPPWIKVEWNEGGVLSDYEPSYTIKKLTASAIALLRDKALDNQEIRTAYLAEYEEAEGTQNFLNALQNYPELKGMQTNLYKCFIPRAWMAGNENAVSGFLHPEGIYDDPKGGQFRKEVYKRLRAHFQFANELRLFPEVHHVTVFSINIYMEKF